MIKVVIFDYDGVIVDSFPTVHEVYQTICERLNKECPADLESFKKVYGYSSREAYKNLGFSEAEAKEADVIYRSEIVKKDPTIFQGIKETIGALKGKYKLVLVSSSPRTEVMQKLEKNGLDESFDLVYASDESGPMRKPKAIQEVFSKLDVKADQVIMIGDRTIDYNEGVSVGIPSNQVIIVEYGWGYNHDQVPKQEVLVNEPRDILRVIDNITSP